ncbi:MAG: hypothetical protein IT261_08510 [Saprospiraceae bacterium]|nr:hypothetical protein [Saprospiraceae bacterium]
MNNRNTPTYRLRFFFDHGSGACLWCGNEVAFEKYGAGPLDAEVYDLNGKISQEAKIKLPESTRQKVLELDKLYSESLNWEDPAGGSKWDKSDWDNFYKLTRALHEEISGILGDDFEIIYEQV